MSFTACRPVAADRDAEIVQALSEDNVDLLLRWPDRVAEKYAKMSLSPYDFLRGSLVLYFRDLRFEGRPSAWATGETARMLTLGDPHVENVGTFWPPGETVLLEPNDFDAVRVGAAHHDVWRMATSLDVLLRARAGIEAAEREQVLSAFADTYAETITHPGAPPSWPPIAARLRDRARRDRDNRRSLSELTEVESGSRALRRGLLEAPPDPRLVGDRLDDLEPALQAAVLAAMPAYAESLVAPVSPTALVVKDVAELRGSGVASYALRRFLVLIEGPSTDLDDDVVLEWKEAKDPSALEVERVLPAPPYTSNAERIVLAARVLQSQADADRWLGFAIGYRVAEETKANRSFSVDRTLEELDSGAIGVGDLRDLGALMGRVLASAHGRTQTLGGVGAGQAIASALGDRVAFTQEVVAVAEVLSARNQDDFVRFQALLTQRGPLLGYLR